MSLTINSPHKSHAGGSTLAGFGAVNVTVRSALTAGPIGSERSALSPEGMSTDRING